MGPGGKVNEVGRRCAVVLLGNVRTWAQCKDTFMRVFGDSDVFISTYDRQYEYHPYVKGLLDYHGDATLSVKHLANLFAELNVKGIQIEEGAAVEQIIIEESAKFHSSMRNMDTCYAQARKLKNGLELVADYERSQGTTYETVAKTRFDLVYSSFEPTVGAREVLVDAGNTFPNDWFYMTNRAAMFGMSAFMYDEFYSPRCADSNRDPPHRLLLNAIKSQELTVASRRVVECVMRINGPQYY